MGFSHVLPSNAGLKTFPKNNASAYSTPLQRPYNLTGKWEVGLQSVTYSGCINTFNDDTIKVGRMLSTPELLKEADKPLRIKLPVRKTTKDIMKEINTVLKGILELKLDDKEEYCSWKVIDKNMAVGISEHLRKRFKLFGDVITTYDHSLSNYFKFSKDYHKGVSELGDEEKLFLILLPLKYNHKKWVLKPSNHNMTVEDLIEQFNGKVDGLEMSMIDKKEKQVTIYKKCSSDNSANCYESIHVLSPDLMKAIGVRRGGIMKGDSRAQFIGYNLAGHFKKEWFVAEYPLNEMSDTSDYVDTTITLQPQAFRERETAVKYLNTLHKAFDFTLNSDNHYLTLHVKDTVRISFNDILRDSLAFDKNEYIGKGKFSATGTFSLTRRIDYLYIYSNLGKYVRIGDTEAPLLEVIPFTDTKCNLMKEKTFENPSFVPLRSNFVSQIDISIRDGSGVIVPFTDEAFTSLRILVREV